MVMFTQRTSTFNQQTTDLAKLQFKQYCLFFLTAFFHLTFLKKYIYLYFFFETSP